MNAIWSGLVVIAVVWGGLTGRMDAVAASIFTSAQSAITLVIGLVGIMVFLLGIMRVAFDGGLRDAIARGSRLVKPTLAGTLVAQLRGRTQRSE